MRKLLITSSVLGILASTSAFAGGVVEPVMVPEEVATQTASSSGGILIPLLLLVVVAAAIASSGGDDPVVAVSDARLKTDLRPVGVTHNGLSLYRYRYIGLDGDYEGVMAQDVAERFPEAIAKLPGGYMGVNYAMLGLTFKSLH